MLRGLPAAELMKTGGLTVPIGGVRPGKMAESAMGMANKSVESYVQRNLEMAREVSCRQNSKPYSLAGHCLEKRGVLMLTG